MQLRFFYSEVYFRQLNKHKSTDRAWEEVKRIGKSFERKYKAEIRQIIRTIPKITGKPWRNKAVDVYITDWPGPSFSHPLTLKVRDNLLLMLVILTHELLHDFYLDGKNTEKTEKAINNDVKDVFDKLNINAERQLQTLRSYHEQRFSNCS